MRLVFLGPPGAGKGTQAKLLCEKCELVHVSTGEILRRAVSEHSELGERVQAVVDAGHLVPDDLIVDLIEHRISDADCAKGYVLDGFPRTVAQGEALEIVLDRRGEMLTRVVYFDVPTEQLVARLQGRRGAESRADDSEEIQRERLRVYEQQTAPLLGFYEERKLVCRIDSSGSVEEIHARVLAQLLD